MRLLPLAILLSALAPALGEQPKWNFQHRTIDPEIGKVCYAVTVADVDADGRRDIVAVSENRVLWYSNPDWKARVIIADQTPRDNVCIAPLDIDRDGQVDFALGAGWTKTGTLHWLHRRDSLDEPWEVHPIGQEPWLHRMRFADVLGKGRPQLVISPLNATSGNGVRLTAFEIPSHPREQRWKPTVLDATLNRMHNHWHVDLDGDGAVDTLTASREGIHWIRRTERGWSKIRLGQGAAADEPNQRGAGEIKLGSLSGGTRFLVSVEPMHGHALAVYTEPDEPGDAWARRVIHDGFRRGHALWTADLDGDGDDEIVFGHSDTPDTHGIIVFTARDDTGTGWSKHVIDEGGIATEDLIVAELTGDDRPDIVAGGRATRNVKLYVNLAP